MTPANVVELLLPPAVSAVESERLPPAAPPPESEPIVSPTLPVTLMAVPAAFARLIAAKSPMAVPPSRWSVPPLTLRIPAYVPGANVVLFSRSVPPPILFRTALVDAAGPRPGPREIEALRIDRSAARGDGDAAPRVGDVDRAPICQVPPSSVTCAGCKPSAAGAL